MTKPEQYYPCPQCPELRNQGIGGKPDFTTAASLESQNQFFTGVQIPEEHISTEDSTDYRMPEAETGKYTDKNGYLVIPAGNQPELIFFNELIQF